MHNAVALFMDTYGTGVMYRCDLNSQDQTMEEVVQDSGLLGRELRGRSFIQDWYSGMSYVIRDMGAGSIPCITCFWVMEHCKNRWNWQWHCSE